MPKNQDETIDELMAEVDRLVRLARSDRSAETTAALETAHKALADALRRRDTEAGRDKSDSR